MNQGSAKKISISSQPPAPLTNVRPFPFMRVSPSRRDSDLSHLARREESEKALAHELDEYLKSKRKMRDLLDALAKDYEFLERGRFVNELCERIEKFPESRSKVGFIVSIFAIYEYTGHQDLAIRSADFCLRMSQNNYGMASAHSTLLCRIADNAACSGATAEMCRDIIEKSMDLSGRFWDNAFSTLRAISEVSTFCLGIRLKSSEDSQPGIEMGQLPLQEPNLFLTFLAALESIFSYSRERPAAINEFIACCMDMSRACRAELFVSSVLVLAWAAKLGGSENEKYVRETLMALQSWDQEHLACMETTLVNSMKPPQKG